MAKYQLKTSSTVEAFVVGEVSPAFHDVILAFLDNSAVVIAPSATVVGDYFVQPGGTSADHFSAKADFEALYAPLVG